MSRRLAGVSQSLATCFALDFSAPTALEVAARETKGPLGKQLNNALVLLKEGQSLSSAFANAGLDEELVKAAKKGERSGDFAKCFRDAGAVLRTLPTAPKTNRVAKTVPAVA